MKKSVLICDFSGVYEEEGFLRELEERGIAVERLDFRGLDGAQCYCDADTERQIIEAIEGRDELVHWIDSGDYHYMSLLFAEKIEEAYTLLLLDNHPDDQPPGLGEILSCGGWVMELKKRSESLERVLAVGPEGGLNGLDELKEAFGRYAPKRIYLSLDKDVLSPDYARCDWSQGKMELEELLEILRFVLGYGAEVIAFDICGELSEAKGARAEDFELNLRTNIEIQKLISDYLN